MVKYIILVAQDEMLDFHCQPELVLDKIYYRHGITVLTTRLELGLLHYSESKLLKAKENLLYEAFLQSPHLLAITVL